MMTTESLFDQRTLQGEPARTHTDHPRRDVNHQKLVHCRFRIDGISWAGDAIRLEHRLSRQAGVVGVSVNPINDLAYIAFDPKLTSASLLQRQIEFSGFSATAR